MKRKYSGAPTQINESWQFFFFSFLFLYHFLSVDIIMHANNDSIFSRQFLITCSAYIIIFISNLQCIKPMTTMRKYTNICRYTLLHITIYTTFVLCIDYIMQFLKTHYFLRFDITETLKFSIKQKFFSTVSSEVSSR